MARAGRSGDESAILVKTLVRYAPNPQPNKTKAKPTPDANTKMIKESDTQSVESFKISILIIYHLQLVF